MKAAHLIIASGIVCSIVSSQVQAKDTGKVVFIGSYAKVESSAGGHCHGYGVDLWKRNDQLFGLLHYATGLCGDPPCGVLKEVSYDAKTGGFKFSVATAIASFKFTGRLTQELLSGSLQRQHPGPASLENDNIVLPRERTPLEDEYHNRIHSLAEWHEQYDSIGRCLGVSGYLK
jgi:hypothetical protein